MLSKIDQSLRPIEVALADRGLALRRPAISDIPALLHLQSAVFPDIPPRQKFSDLELYRLIEFGNSVVLHDGAGEVVGCHLVFLANDEDRTAVSSALVVLSRFQGLGLGPLIYRHSLWRSLAAGARIFQGTVAPTNLSSLSMVLNKGGAICDRFHPGLGTSQVHRFSFECRLEAQRLSRLPLDLEKVAAWVRRSREGTDYLLTAPEDAEGLEAMYRETRMRVVAVAPPGLLGRDSVLFAMPASGFEGIRSQLGKDAPR